MRVFSTPTGFFVRLDRGEDLMSSLESLVRERQVPAAALSGIGAVAQTTLGYFDLERREYLRREYAGNMELVSLIGNLAWADQQPIVHAHAVIAGADGLAHGGHLFGARVAATAEIAISTFPDRRERALDLVTGLKLISDQ